MKKYISLTFLFFAGFFLSAQDYKIDNIDYEIHGAKFSFSGKTQVYALEQKVKIDKKRVFTSTNELDLYLEDYKQLLLNTRVFQNVQITYSVEPENSENLSLINLFVEIWDSNNFLAAPHVFNYDSNDGWTPKLKAKDFNFLGTLNPLETEIYAIVPFNSDNKKLEAGSVITYDYPFKIGNFDMTLVNNYTISYVSNQKSPQWNLLTGLKASYPVNGQKINFEFNQKELQNFKYSQYDDVTSFSEEAKVSFSKKITTFDYLGNLTTEPYLNALINWDKNGINPENTELSSPIFAIGQNLFAERIDWINNFRTGFSFSLITELKYNFQRQLLYPFVSYEMFTFISKELWAIPFMNSIGSNTRFFAFNYFINNDNPYFKTDGVEIGEKIRGVRDVQYYKNSDMKSLTSISGLVGNIDFPIRFWKSDFSQKVLNYLNIELQFAPFFDFGLIHNKITDKYFSLKDGFYGAGMEFFIYPQKFSSFIIRVSIGFDVGQLWFSDYLDYSWRNKDSSVYEINFGIGLYY